MIVNSGHETIDMFTDMFLPAIDTTTNGTTNVYNGKKHMTKKVAAAPSHPTYNGSHFEDDYSEDFEQESKDSYHPDFKNKTTSVVGNKSSQITGKSGSYAPTQPDRRGQPVSLSPKKPDKINEDGGPSSPRKKQDAKASAATTPSESFKEPVKPMKKTDVISNGSSNNSKAKKTAVSNSGSPVYKNSKDVGFVKNLSPQSQQASPERFVSHDTQLDKTISKTAQQLQQYAIKKQSQKEKQLDAVLSYNVDNMDEYLQDIHNKYIHHIAAWKIAYFVQLCRTKKAFSIVVDLTRKNGELKQGYKRSQSKGREAQLYIQKLLDNIQELQCQEGDFKGERDELILKINSKNSEIFQLQQLQAGAHDNNVHNLQTQLELTQKTVQDLVINNAKLHVYLEDAKTVDQEKDSEIDGLNNIVSDSRKQIEYYKNELKRMIDAEQNVKNSVTAKELEIKKENEAINSLLMQHKQQELISSQEILYLKRAVDHEKDNTAAEKARGEKLRSDTQVLQNYLTEVALDIQTAKNENKQKDADIAKLRQRVEELLVIITDLNTDIGGYKYVVNTDREMIQQQQGMIDSLTSDLSTKIAFIDSLDLPEKNILVEQIQSLTIVLGEKDVKIDNLNNELASKVVVIEALIRDMKSDRSRTPSSPHPGLGPSAGTPPVLSPMKHSLNLGEGDKRVHDDDYGLLASFESKNEYTAAAAAAATEEHRLDSKEKVLSRMEELESRLLLLMTSIENRGSSDAIATVSPSKFIAVARSGKENSEPDLKLIGVDDVLGSDAKDTQDDGRDQSEVIAFDDDDDHHPVDAVDDDSAVRPVVENRFVFVGSFTAGHEEEDDKVVSEAVSRVETRPEAAIGKDMPPNATSAEPTLSMVPSSSSGEAAVSASVAPPVAKVVMMESSEPFVNASNLLSSPNKPRGFDFSLINSSGDTVGDAEIVSPVKTTPGTGVVRVFDNSSPKAQPFDADPATHSPTEGAAFRRSPTGGALEGVEHVEQETINSSPSKKEVKNQKKEEKAARKAARAKKREERAARRAERAASGLAPLDADREENFISEEEERDD